jgi:hypothetical protein
MKLDTPVLDATGPRTLPGLRGPAAPVPDGGSELPHGRRARSRLIAVALAAALLIPAGLMLYQSLTPKALPKELLGTKPVSAQTLADELGIKVNMVGVSAGGGMIDLRFSIVDRQKAAAAFGLPAEENTDTPGMHVHASLPALYAEDSNTVIAASEGMGHHFSIEKGASYFILFPNPGGVIQQGTPISVVIGGVRLQHLVTQG